MRVPKEICKQLINNFDRYEISSLSFHVVIGCRPSVPMKISQTRLDFI